MASLETVQEVLELLEANSLNFRPQIELKVLVRSWDRYFRHESDRDLIAAVDRWLHGSDQDRWPSTIQIRKTLRQLQNERGQKARESAEGCQACGATPDHKERLRGGSGFRYAIQHVYQRPSEGDAIQRIVIKRCRCDCRLGQMANRPRFKPGSGERADDPPALDFHTIIEKCRRPRGPWPAQLFVTGTGLRFDERDTDPRSPFYDQPSPEERFGPTPEAARLRWTADQAHQHGPVWAAQHIARLSGGRVRVPIQPLPDSLSETA